MPTKKPPAKTGPTPEWRRFEEMVAHIEESLAPKGASVKSPDRVRDLVTGRLREVDATIRFEVGSTPILITLECRKRKGIQDDTWIEQLATKRQKIGAAKTIAVSSKGFSESAMRSAKLYGIELRNFADRIDEEIVQEFLSGFKLTVMLTEWQAIDVAFILDDGTQLDAADFGDDLKESLLRETGGVLASEVGTGRPLTIDSIVRHAGDSDVPANGIPVKKVATLTFEPARFVVSTQSGRRFLQRLEVIFTMTRRDLPAPAKSFYEYSSPEGIIRRTVEGEAEASATERITVSADIVLPSLATKPSAPKSRRKRRP